MPPSQQHWAAEYESASAVTVSRFNTLVVASGNPGKLKEFSVLLAPLGLSLLPQSDWNVPEAVENAPTFVENALIKARHAAELTGQAAVADDSGLVVPALDGAPGIYSSRYAGTAGDDLANNRKLLEAMSGLQGRDRAAWFQCVIVLVRHAADPVPLIASGRWYGEIATSMRGHNGFGYDPLFWLPGHACTCAELSAETKSRLSHRGQACRQLLSLLEAERAG